ncbi:MAG: hypothetical protein JWM86_2471 [Thermoleophilia bacterium]|nr:hypothetical protein [Thermoleophilia bacterium]
MMTEQPDTAADQADPTVRRLDGPTPAGGAYAIMTYLDAAGEVVPRSRATRANIVEYTDDGIVLNRTDAVI